MRHHEVWNLVRRLLPTGRIVLPAEDAPSDDNGARRLDELLGDAVVRAGRRRIPVVEADVGAVLPVDEPIEGDGHVEQDLAIAGVWRQSGTVANKARKAASRGSLGRTVVPVWA